MRNNVIHIRCQSDFALLHTFFTIRMLSNETVTKFLPSVAITTLSGVPRTFQAESLSLFHHFCFTLPASFFVKFTILFRKCYWTMTAGISTEFQKSHRNKKRGIKPQSVRVMKKTSNDPNVAKIISLAPD